MAPRRLSLGVLGFMLAMTLGSATGCSVSPTPSARSDASSDAVASLDADASPDLRFEHRNPLLTIVDFAGGWAEQPDLDPAQVDADLILGDAATALSEADRTGLSSEATGAIDVVIAAIGEVGKVAEAEPVDVATLKAMLLELAEAARTAIQLLDS